MELKQLITKFTYRIEPKPEGGFIAHATDPAVPALEASTREELQRKIQETILAGLTSEFPGLKLPTTNQETKFAFHVESKPGGGFVIQSADPDAKPIEGASHDEIAAHFAEKLLGFVGNHFAPELSQLLAAQGGSGDVKVVVNRTSFSFKTSAAAAGAAQALLPTGLGQANTTAAGGTAFAAETTQTPNLNDVREAFLNEPIKPESNKLTSVMRFLLGLVILTALMYFLTHRH